MEHDDYQELVEEGWRTLTRMHAVITDALESVLQAEHGLSVSEFAVLQCLAEKPDHHMRMQQLADAVGLSQSALSRLVERLEARTCGLIERYLCIDDRRGVYTQLTAEGVRRLIEATPTYRAVLAATWERVRSQVDLAALERALKHSVEDESARDALIQEVSELGWIANGSSKTSRKKLRP